MKTTPAAAQTTLVASLLGSLGVAVREPFDFALPDGGFTHGRVTHFDPARDAADAAPHGALSAHAARGHWLPRTTPE